MNTLPKFRAWDIEKKRMSLPFILGDFEIKWNDGDIPMPLQFAVSKTIARRRCKFMRFTDLLDKNKSEIYEGDIIQGFWRWEMRKWEIRYTAPYFHFVGSYSHMLDRIFSASTDNLEIIGNIYENEELLK